MTALPLFGLLLLSGWSPPPSPTQHVADPTAQLPAAAFERLDAALADFERTSGHQLVVYVAHSAGEVPLETFAAQSFEAWKVGRAGLDDGAVLFVFTQDRRARIEVGYGLEERLPDAVASRILRETLAPAMAAGQLEAGLSATIGQLMRTLGGEPGSPTQAPDTLPPYVVAILVVAGLVLVVLAIRYPRAALSILTFLWMFRGGGGRGGGRGGFRGGGGRSGGGGASVGW